jgi:hypothetical protein
MELAYGGGTFAHCIGSTAAAQRPLGKLLHHRLRPDRVYFMIIESAMTNVKKIVLLSGFRIFPCNTGGHIRSGSIARALARMGHQVLIYSLAGRNADYRARHNLRRSYLVERIEHNLTEETNLGLGFGLLQTIGRRLHYPRVWQYALLRRGLIPRRLQLALQDSDLVISDMPWCPPPAVESPRKPWYLLSHNLEHRLLEQGGARDRRFAHWMQQVESAAPQRYRDIFACAEEDRDFFRSQDVEGRLKLPIIGNGVDPNAYRVPAGTRERMRAELGVGDADHLLVFSGSKFAPNLEALEGLRNFCKAEAEFLARERVHILVLGSMSPAPSREGALIATGRVPDVVPYFAAGDAGLNPVTRGSGANVKLFEYLAAQLPVISTLFGVRGTALEPETDFLLCDVDHLKDSIGRFVRSRSREGWKRYAHDVWARHGNSCDIELLVKHAVRHMAELEPDGADRLNPVPASD